ncbi:NUDIX domain-containing protein [candidate division KSB1 bacterium]|nr:NUDIX domain-containing protein [candidate division KSB1 bacterium]
MSNRDRAESERIYPQYPRLGVGVLVIHHQKVLLVKRGQEPKKGIWTIPGGLVKLGEPVLKAAHRELWEECQIKVHINRLLDVFEFIDKDHEQRIRYHYTVLEYLAEWREGDIHPGSDVAKASWFSVHDLDHLETTVDTRRLIDKALNPI